MDPKSVSRPSPLTWKCGRRAGLDQILVESACRPFFLSQDFGAARRAWPPRREHTPMPTRLPPPALAPGSVPIPPDDAATEPATISIPAAARMLGVGKRQMYRAAADGSI